MDAYYVHEEPILNGNGRIYGHEFTFRDPSIAYRGGPWPTIRLDEKMMRSLSPEWLDRLIGNRRAFIHIDATALRFDGLGSLPKSSIFQISERDGLDKEVLLKSAVLKRQGFQIAAEDILPSRGLLPFHQIADFVLIDMSSRDSEQISSAIHLFNGRPLRRIATGVQSRGAFLECRERGFDLFQGIFFIDPSRGTRESISDSQTLLMRLFTDLRLNGEIAEIENIFKSSPKLTYGLLQLINSAFFGVSVKVVSIRQAITLLGYESLLKWVTLLLLTVDHSVDHQANPVIEKSILRGRVMESLARQVNQKGALPDAAFITGMLSLFTVLFDIALVDLSSEMHLSDEIQAALLNREGLLGRLLNIAEMADRQEYEKMEADLPSLKLTMADVFASETDAISDYQSCFADLVEDRAGRLWV